jgi:alpha-ribazole phosphatase
MVRHARPLVGPGVCYGALDLEADPAATQEAAAILAGQLPAHATMLSSPLRRCIQLADALHVLRPDLGWRCDPKLREMDFGCWEGVPWSAIPQDAFGPWMADFHAHRFGGRDSVGEMMQRVAQALDAASRQGECVWITHAGVIRAVTLLIRGVHRLQSPAQWPSETVSFGVAQCLQW